MYKYETAKNFVWYKKWVEIFTKILPNFTV